MTMRTRRLALSSALLCLVAAGCSTDSKNPEGDVGAAGSAPRSSTPTTPSTPVPKPKAVPAAEGLVHTGGPVLVLGRGDQPPRLCLGGVLASLPPQCGDVPVLGWNWAELPADSYETSRSTRWGVFAVTGRFDGTNLTLTEAVPVDQVPPAPQVPRPEREFACPEPAGGWRTLDPTTATEGRRRAVLDAARYLPGYAAAQLVRTGNPTRTVVEVRVTKDVAGAERVLRSKWGGPLCVAKARFTAGEFHKLQGKARDLPGNLSVSAENQRISTYVIFDNGSFQAWADGRFGRGLVTVTSALVPVA